MINIISKQILLKNWFKSPKVSLKYAFYWKSELAVEKKYGKVLMVVLEIPV